MTAPITGTFERERQAARQYYQNAMQQRAGTQGQPMSVPGFGGVQPQGSALNPALEVQPPLTELPDTELLGQAAFYGIDRATATQMPREALVAYIAQMRAETQTQSDSAMGLAATAAQIPARFALGIGQGITSGLKNLPVVGESFARMEALQDADMFLNEMEEGVRATAPANAQWVGGTSEVAGHIAALWVPGNAAWKIAGVAGRLVPFAGKVSPIMRAAAQGGASAWLLEGGSEHPYLAVGLGAALGPLATPAVQQRVVQGFAAANAAAARVAGKFGGTWERAVGKAGPDILQTAPGPESMEIPAMLGGDAPARNALLEQLKREAYDETIPPETRQSALTLIDELTNPVGSNTAAIPQPRVQADLSDMEIPVLSGPRPSNALDVDEASAAAAQMSKQQTVIDSPQLGRAAGLAEIDDVVVAQAAWNRNPGGVSTIPGVADPATLIQGLSANWPPGEVPHVAFARRGTRLDAIISDEPVTPRMIESYEKFGFYPGQTARTTKGTEVRILDVDVETGVVKVKGGTKTRTMLAKNLLPDSSGQGIVQAPGTWDAFKVYQMQRAYAAADAIGGLSPERVERIAQENMPAYIDDFLDSLGETRTSQRARLKTYFNERFLEEYTALVPEEVALRDAILDQVDELQVGNATLGNTSSVDDLVHAGEARGVTVVQTPEGFVTIDNVGDAVSTGPTQISFATREAAEEWVRNTPREMPDITPASDVPLEIAESLITTSKLDPVLRADRVDEVAQESATELVTALRADGSELADIVEAEVAAIAGGGAPPGGTLPTATSGAGGQNPRTPLEVVEDAWNYALSRWQPMRARFQEMDRRLSAAGLGETRVYDDWNAVKTAADKNHNWQHPHLSRWREIMSVFKPSDLKSGLVTQIYELDDDAARIVAAEAAGFGPEHLRAFEDMNQFFRDLFPETGLDAAREIKRYISHVRKREMLGAGSKAFEEYPMNPVVDAFYEHARAGGLQMREMDARQLGNIYVRALGFQKHMAEPWGAAMAKWNDLAHVPEMEGLAGVMTNWLKMVRTGYNPAADVTLDGIHVAMKSLFPGMTKDQARQLFNNGLSTTHSALLGFSPHVMARDLMQLFLATPRTGHRQMGSAIAEYLNGTDAEKAAIFELGTKHGWIVLGKPRIASPGVFEQGAGSGVGAIERQALGLAPEAAQGATEGGLWPVVRAVEKVGDFLPGSLRNLEGSPITPLHFYTKQGERMRLVTGLAQFRKTEAAIAKYRKVLNATVVDGSPEAIQANASRLLDDLMGDSAARTFDPAVQRKFKELIAAGNQDEEAAAYMARELADATMFRYGTIENPEIGRSVHGRIGMQMGSFSTQYYQYLKESMRNGTVSDKARFVVTHGAVAGALMLAKEATGWDFSKWQFHNALTFTGGPWLGIAMDAVSGAQGSVAAATRGGAYAEREAAGLDRAAGEAVRLLNPLAGGQRTVNNILHAVQSPSPAWGVARTLITGDKASNTAGLFQQDMVPALNAVPVPMSSAPAAVPIAPQPMTPGPVRAVSAGIPWPARTGASDVGRIYTKNGNPVYDSTIPDPNGQVPTHRLSEAARLLQPGETWEDRELRLRSADPTTLVRGTANRKIEDLHPEMVPRLLAIQEMARDWGLRVDVAETKRPQERSDYLFAQGRNPGVPGPIVTWTMTSNHYDGRAVDLIVNGDISGKDPGYAKLWELARIVGLVPFGPGDEGHLTGTDSSFAATRHQYSQGSGGGGAF